MGGKRSDFLSTLAVDEAVVQHSGFAGSASGRSIDRSYVDSQALTLQQGLLDALMGGVQATWMRVSMSSPVMNPGDVVCLANEASPDGVPIVTTALPTPLGLVGAASGIVMRSAGPGTRVLVAVLGTLGPAITGLGPVAGCAVVGNDGRCQQVATISNTDVPVGAIDAGGNLAINRYLSPAMLGITLPGGSHPARASTRGLVFRGDTTSFISSSGFASRWNDADGRGTYFASPSSGRNPSTGIGRGGLKYMRTGVIGGVARFMVQTFSPALNAHTYTQIVFFEPAIEPDTTTRVWMDTDSTLRIGCQAAGSSRYGNKCWLAFNGTFTWSSPAGPMTDDPGVGQPFEQAVFGGASEFNLVQNGITGTNYALFNAASNATTINRITFGIDDAHTTDALSTESKIYEVLLCNVELTNDEIDAVVADFVNSIGGYLLLTDTNSQGTPVPAHVTASGYSFTNLIAAQSAYWVVARLAGTGGITTPQIVSRWPTNTLPMLSSRFHKRFAGFWEGENDCYNNGASSTPTDTSYAATAWNNMKQWADLARQGGAQKIFILTILPTTAPGVPANYENLRLAVNVLIRNHYADTSGVTGQPYFDYLCDIGSTDHSVSPYGDIALVAPPAYPDGNQHIGDDGHAWIAAQLLPIVEGWAL